MRSVHDFDSHSSSVTASEIDELSDRTQNLEQRIQSLNDSYETLKKREMELTEWRWVLREAGGFFDRARGQTDEIRQSLEENTTTPLCCKIRNMVSTATQVVKVDHSPS